MSKTRRAPAKSSTSKNATARLQNEATLQKFDSLFHEIQNHFHIIKMEFDLLRMPDIEAFDSQRAATALRRLTVLVGDLETMVGALDAVHESA